VSGCGRPQVHVTASGPGCSPCGSPASSLPVGLSPSTGSGHMPPGTCLQLWGRVPQHGDEVLTVKRCQLVILCKPRALQRGHTEEKLKRGRGGGKAVSNTVRAGREGRYCATPAV
jgi:hypothetical protein